MGETFKFSITVSLFTVTVSLSLVQWRYIREPPPVKFWPRPWVQLYRWNDLGLAFCRPVYRVYGHNPGIRNQSFFDHIISYHIIITIKSIIFQQVKLYHFSDRKYGIYHPQYFPLIHQRVSWPKHVCFRWWSCDHVAGSSLSIAYWDSWQKRHHWSMISTSISISILQSHQRIQNQTLKLIISFYSTQYSLWQWHGMTSHIIEWLMSSSAYR